MSLTYTRKDENVPKQFPDPSQRRELNHAENGGIYRLILRRRRIFVACVTLSLMVGAIYVLVIPPLYMASTTILIDPRLGKKLGSDPVEAGFMADNTAIDSQLELLTSQVVLTRVAKQAGLKDDDEFNGKDHGLLRRILRGVPSYRDGVDLSRLEAAITVKRAARDYLVTIDVLARSPVKAAEIANDLVEAYFQDQIDSRVAASRSDMGYVEQRLRALGEDIKTVETRLEDYKIQNNIVDTSGLRSNEQQVFDLTRALVVAGTRLSDAQSRVDEVNRLASEDRLDGSDQAGKSPTIERLRREQTEVQKSIATLAVALGPNHPEFIDAQQSEEKIAQLIKDELERMRLSAESEVGEARADVKLVTRDLDAAKTQSVSLSAKLIPLGKLERTLKTLQRTYALFAQINDNLSQQDGLAPPGRIVTFARAPRWPAYPRETVVAILSISSGIFLGLAASLLIDCLGYEVARGKQVFPGGKRIALKRQTSFGSAV